MKKLATAFASLAMLTLVAPPAFAGPPLQSKSGVASSRVMAAVPPAEPGASGAIIRDESCFANQLGGSGAWGSVSAERVDLPFAIQSDGKYWYDIWVSPQGALSHDEGGILAVGFDVENEDLIRSSEVYAPMLAGSSVTSWFNDSVDYLSRDFGQHLSPVYYGETTFGGRKAFCVTWLDVAPQVPVGSPEWVDNWGYGYWTQAFEFDASRRNSFQALIVDRSDQGPGNFDLVYNYDSIQWQAEQNAIDSTTGVLLSPRYAEAGWSLGIPNDDSDFIWRGWVDGRVNPDSGVMAEPQLPYPEDHWWPQHGALGNRDTYLDSSPTGLAVTQTNSTQGGTRFYQMGRHIFEIRRPPMLLWLGDWTHGEPQYVALGDSFQSGEGTEDAGEFLPGTDTWKEFTLSNGDQEWGPSNLCHRSDKAYPELLNGWIPASMGVTLDFWACSGALIGDMRDTNPNNHSDPPWNDPGKPSALAARIDDGSMSSLDRLGDETWLVTIGAGGNDAGFEKTLKSCIKSPVSCQSDTKAANLTDVIKGERAPLDALYADIRRDAPNAAVFVLGYPRFFASQEEVEACWTDYEATWTVPRYWSVGIWLTGTLGVGPRDISRLPPGADSSIDFGQDTVDAQKKCLRLEDPVSGINRFEQRFINNGVSELNYEVRRAAAGQAFYVDIEDVGRGREIGSSGDSSKWFMNGALAPVPTLLENPQSFHPNVLGHELIANEFVRQLIEPRYGQAPVINPREIRSYIYTVPWGGGSTLDISGFWPGSDVVLRLISPSGVEYTRSSEPPGSSRITTALSEYIEVTDPEPGDWTIEAYGADIAPGGESFLLDAFYDPPANELPVGSIHMDRQGSTVTFSAPGSVDPDGTIVNFWWDLGDGTLMTGPQVTHTYASTGTYEVGLILTDDRGGEGFVFADNPVVVSAAATAVAHKSGGSGTSEPSPSATAGPQPSPSAGPVETPGAEPTPSPGPTSTATGTSEPGSGGWAWLMGLVLLVSAAAVGGLWYRQRLTREP
jgi:hypothetical protein